MPKVKVNKIKTKSTLTNRLMAAAGIIVNCYNERMNTHKVMNSMILKRAGTKKWDSRDFMRDLLHCFTLKHLKGKLL